MERKGFITKCGACGALSLLSFLGLNNIQAMENRTKKDDSDSEPMNKTQIRHLLKFIDSSINEPDKEKIFNKLGVECLYSRDYDKWLAKFKNDPDEYFNRVKRGEAKYWEKLEYDKSKSVITLVGKKSQTCNCQYGRCDEPPKSLCNYCCKRFQEELFGLLLGKKVTVRIDETVILGSERCSTTIFVG
jgi:hypothetical protein